jgi:hypothetical protein
MATTKKPAKKNDYYTWRNTAAGRLVFAVVYAVLAYVFISLAIDSGSPWLYILTLVCVGMVLRHLFGALKKLVYDKK